MSFICIFLIQQTFLGTVSPQWFDGERGMRHLGTSVSIHVYHVSTVVCVCVCVCVCIDIYIYIYIYIYVIILSWKQCALPIITTMALWQIMHLGTQCTLIYIYIYIYIYYI